MPDQPLDAVRLSTVTVTGRLVIGDQKFQANEAAPLHYWQELGVDYQEHLKAAVRRRLGELVIEALDPEVTVELPAPTLGEAMAEALKAYDEEADPLL